MSALKQHTIKRFSLGYRFSDEREALSLVYICYFLIIIFSVVVALIHSMGDELLPVSFRYHGMIALALVTLLLLRFRLVALARILVLTASPFLILILPPLTGLVEDEFFFWFPYVPIAMSLVPHFILHTKRHRLILLLVLLAYLMMGIFMDKVLIHFAGDSVDIIGIVRANHFYYTVIPVFIFLFVNVALGILFAKNYAYQQIMSDQRKELLQAEKMASLGTLSAGIAHEMNNPLNFISGSLQVYRSLDEQWLKLPHPGEEELLERRKQVDDLVSKALEGVQRGEDIVNKLTLFSKPDLYPPTRVKVKDLIHKSMKGIEARIPHYIYIRIQIPEHLSLRCQETQIRMVCSHILRNAIDAIESKEHRGDEFIEITASPDHHGKEGMLRISFCNSGPPIPEGDLKRIFDPFFTSRDAGEGTGMGMSLSYMIVREHGGRIEVKHAAEKVCFDLFLPADKLSA